MRAVTMGSATQPQTRAASVCSACSGGRRRSGSSSHDGGNASSSSSNASSSSSSSDASGRRREGRRRVLRNTRTASFGAGVASPGTSGTRDPILDDHVPIDRFYDGLRQIHTSPDIFLVDDFLTAEACDAIVAAARAEEMDQSPVVYAGWTNDVSDVVSTAARGPALWAAALAMLSGAGADGPGPGLLLSGAGTYACVVAAAAAGAGAWVKAREAQLRGMRTSTSCVLRGESAGERAYVRAAEALMPGSSFTRFEAPTVIRYEPGQRLAPHFDANRGADVEDANRGGQTLATLLVYLNDADDERAGGSTRFGRLDLEVAPKKGQCLLFFPAAADGTFDERVEHEGMEAGTEKWICRIWRHADVVPPPFGLPDGYVP